MYLLDMTYCLIMTTIALVFAVTLQVFATLLKIIGKILTINFSKGVVKAFKITLKPTHFDSMRKAVIPSIYCVIWAWNQKKK